jgi:hypothetical protein
MSAVSYSAPVISSGHCRAAITNEVTPAEATVNLTTETPRWRAVTSRTMARLARSQQEFEVPPWGILLRRKEGRWRPGPSQFPVFIATIARRR